MEVIQLNDNNKLETLKFGISVEEARKQLGIGRNLMLKLVKVNGFPAIRFKRKINAILNSIFIFFSIIYKIRQMEDKDDV